MQKYNIYLSFTRERVFFIEIDMRTEKEKEKRRRGVLYVYLSFTHHI